MHVLWHMCDIKGQLSRLSSLFLPFMGSGMEPDESFRPPGKGYFEKKILPPPNRMF